jgi:hypothetical protein
MSCIRLNQESNAMSNRVNHQDVVKKLLDTKAVDFNAIGKVVAELGPSLSMADEPWEDFCLTMQRFIRLFHINPGFPGGGPTVENLADLRGAAGELKG